MDKKELIESLLKIKESCVKCRDCPFQKITGDPFDYYECSFGKCVIIQAVELIEKLSKD